LQFDGATSVVVVPLITAVVALMITLVALIPALVALITPLGSGKRDLQIATHPPR
jgi:hypothetical protein